MGRVEGKIAIVTGGLGGIGAATVRALSKEGACVFIADLPGAQANVLAGDINGEFLALDVTQESQWNDVVSTAARTKGGIDILVNAAGIEGDVVNGTPEATSYAEWRRVMAVNLDGTFLGCREVLPVMRKAGRGSIINISSIVSYFATANATAYGASKGGVMQLTKSVALFGSQGGYRIRCNSVHPGIIATRMIESISSQTADRRGIGVAAARDATLARVPFGEAGRAEDVAELILFLASDESRYATGSEFSVDGGWRLMGQRPQPTG